VLNVDPRVRSLADERLAGAGEPPAAPGESFAAPGGPFAASGEPSASSGEPLAGRGEPFAAPGGSSAFPGEPSAGAGAPSAASGEPFASPGEPSAGSGERQKKVRKPHPILLSWSGGKDSAFALHTLRSSPDFEPVGLLTTITEDYDRISIHGVRCELLERQAESIGLPLHKVLIPKDCTNEIYEDRLAAALRGIKSQGIHHVAFGDLFLEDIRAYREKQMAPLGLQPVFPVWGLDTTDLAHDLIRLGFQALLVCVDTDILDPVFAGRAYDEDLLRDLPPDVDLCGENGEFHTFVHAGPIFREPIAIKLGRVEGRGRFWFRDVETV
jgi:uncharacterized protein (TIGR00290 family)